MTQAQLKRLLVYNKHSGIFVWKMTRGGTAHAGTVAGTVNKNDGHRRIAVLGRGYLASRLAWFYVTGVWPIVEVDHRDRNPANDRWSNLRLATSSENKCNRAKRKDSTLKLKGVMRNHSRFSAFVQMHGKREYLGTYDTQEEAHEKYLVRAAELHGSFHNS